MEGRRTRTRRQWEFYYEQLHHELKQQRKRNKNGDVDVEALIKDVKKEIAEGDEVVKKNGDGVGVGDEILEISGENDVADDDEEENSLEYLGTLKKENVDVDVDDEDVNSVEFKGKSSEKQRNGDCVDVDDDVDVDEDDVDVDMDVDDDDGGESDSVEILGAKNTNVDDGDEAESSDSKLKVYDLSEGVGNSRTEEDSLVEIRARDEPQIDDSVDSGRCSEEDSNESESEPTSEEDDELFDEDYERSESSISGSSEDSEDEEDENENVVNRAKVKKMDSISKSSDDSEDEEDENENVVNRAKGKIQKTLGTNGEIRRKSDERSSDCEIRSNDEWDCEISTGIVNEKLVVSRRRRRIDMEKESRDELDTGDEKEMEKEKVSKVKKNSTDEGDECSMENVTLGTIRPHSARGSLIKILVDTMNLFKEKQYSIDENAVAENALPSRFRFEDEVEPPPVKSEWELHVDSLFRDMELGIREIEADCTNSYTIESDDDLVEIDESPAACCRRGKHHEILDEQIGVICKYCHTVIMEIKHVLPDFHVPTWGSRDRRYYRDELSSSFFSDFEFDTAATSPPDSPNCTKGTVWDLVPGVEKELYPHQREGFEFMWRNIAGDITIENLRQTLADETRGCIISHAPGTGKTRLTIVFLQTFLKLYPSCSPMIIAPRGMLLTWEAEFKKWNFNVAFHNLNEKELSGKENVIATELLGQAGAGALSRDDVRLLKLYSWARGGSVLGIGYPLFKLLAGENGRGKEHEKIREVLLERPGLLVLDEGHTPRNHKSGIWNVLTKVSTQRRIILSGTPFQNNLRELYNTLCVVNPRFAHESVAKWRNLRNSGGVSKGHALKLREMLDPFIHVYKGTVLEESLPGLRHALVFLHPTSSQKALMESACEEEALFRRVRMVSLVSLHPSIEAVTRRYSIRKEDITMDIDAGVKARFIFKLIDFADALDERVLVFSQFIDSLVFIKEQLESVYSWRDGREVLYMDGNLDEKKRQESISCFNDGKSEAKVLLASVRACSEGINLVGASRVVLLDTVWNPSVEKQAISRAYRLGQKKIVYVYRLFTSGIEVRQYAQQNLKERISQWIFSLGEGRGEKARAVPEDKVLEAMLRLESFNHIFEKVIVQPKQSDLVATFGLEKR